MSPAVVICFSIWLSVVVASSEETYSQSGSKIEDVEMPSSSEPVDELRGKHLLIIPWTDGQE